MYKVRKVLNNNALLVIDLNKNREIILIGNGIGFNKKVNMNLEKLTGNITKYIQEENIDITNEVSKNDAIYLEIANKLIVDAKKTFENFDTSILIPLSDHICFSIQRIKKKMDINNPFKNDVKLLFAEEYEIALKNKQYIEEKVNVSISEDELSYITLHLHSARSDEKVANSLLLATIINESIQEIEELLNIKIDVNSLAYSRLLTHLKYMFVRSKINEKINLDMDEYTRTKYPLSYKLAQNIKLKLEKGLEIEIDQVEIGYLALHIERICNL